MRRQSEGAGPVLWRHLVDLPGSDAAQALIDQGADVLTHHSGSPAVAQTAQANFRTKGVRVVPYERHARSLRGAARATEHRWGGHTASPSVLAGRKAGINIASGMSYRGRPGLPDAVRSGCRAGGGDRRRHAQALCRACATTPAVRLASGSLGDAQIKAMDWFVEGVVGTVPKAR
jgi:simple sugar transport system substrate-binding protein